MITPEKIESNWNKLIAVITHMRDTTDNDAWGKLLTFYDKHANRIAMMPASMRTDYHNCFPGGYVEHILNVYEIAQDIAELWGKSKPLDFTYDELVFVALHHDLGKFGTEEHEYYVEQDSKWHRDRGELYKNNPAIHFMKVSDRSIFLLNQMGIQLTEKMYLAIKLHDGLYEEANKSYYISYNIDYKLKTDLPYVIHIADSMAARLESSGHKIQSKQKSEEVKPKKKSKALSKFLNE